MSDYYNIIDSAEKRAREEGREEGRLEGRKDAAKKMLASGMSREQVAEILQMTATELEALLAF